jgi:hypothetical protein
VAKTQILDYYIHLRDRATAERLQAALDAGDSTPTPTGPGGLIFIPATGKFLIRRAPDGAATEFGELDTPAGVLPLVAASGVPPTTGAGYISSPWFGTSDAFQTNVATFTRDESWWIGGVTKFYWAGHVVYTPAIDTDPTEATSEEPEPTEPAPIATRLRVVAYAGLGTGEFASDNSNEGTPPTSFSRDAARGIEGFGFALRANGTTADESQIDFESGTLTGWSRGYIRPKRYPTGSVEVWRTEIGGGSSGQGFSIDMTSTGQLALYLNGSSSAHTLVATADPVALNEWAKLDILTFVQQAADLATCKVYRRGVLLFEATLAPGGVQANRVLQHHSWGRNLASGGSNLYLDIADVVLAAAPADKDITAAAWASGTDYAINAIVRQSSKNYRAVVASGPGNGGAVTPGTNSDVWIKLADGIDWLHGSKNVVIRGLSSGADATGWSGDIRLLAQLGDQQAGDALTSSTSGAIVDVVTDVEDVVPRPGLIGLAALEVVAYSRQATAGEATVGYRYAGGSAVDNATNVGSGTLAWTSTRGNLTTTKTPATLDEIRLRYVKAANTNAAVLRTLYGIVELIGTFGPEDIVLEDEDEEAAEEALEPVPIGRTLHNAQFPQSPWARTDYALGPVVVIGGTYTGNGTSQDLSFPVPPAWIFIRPLTGGSGSNMLGACDLQPHSVYGIGIGHGTSTLGWRQNHAYVPASEDADQQMEFLVRVGGTVAQFNANAVTFQYIAFCDPAARFCRAGAVAVNTTLATPFVHPLEDSQFLPEWAFFQREETSTTTTVSMLTKGPGNAAAGASLISSGTDIATAITFGTGQLSLGTGAVSTALDQYSYVLFRRADGNDHPDQAKVMAIGQYTGDGAASRTIALPTTGLRPLWACVQPVTGAAAIVRDPSHTTNTSQTVNSGSTTTTGITAGSVDGFTVGTTLNSNGVVYNYLVFFASATAGNGGWGTNGTYAPVPADSAFPPDWDEPEEIDEPEEPDPEPDANDPGELTTDIAANCLAASTRLCNIALSRIGVTDRLTSLADDDSLAAEQCRLIYKTEIDATLRAFDWHFATAYAEPVLVDGAVSDPVNPDWTYSYREPSDSVKVRRIVNPVHGRSYDPDPPRFDKSSDTNGQLIFSNEPGDKIDEDADLTIEYTRRLDCPASRGDAIFRSCAAWRLAAALAIPLGRDEKAAKWALANFAAELPVARTTSSNEAETIDQGTTGEPDWLRGR